MRAFKHILQAVIAAVVNPEKLAMSIAAALNLMLGVPGNRELNQSCNAHSLVWRWLEVFLKKRYEWDFSTLNYKDVRKFAVLRGLCHKVFWHWPMCSKTLSMPHILLYWICGFCSFMILNIISWVIYINLKNASVVLREWKKN